MSGDLLSAIHSVVLLIPIVTTCFATYFCIQLFMRFRTKGGGLHLVWWLAGMATYGVGTFTEAWTSVAGWNPFVFRLWYISGALLGGYPLAQGTIYLLMSRRFAHVSAIVVVSVVVIAAVLVFSTPLRLDLVQAHRLNGNVIEWAWIRLISPFINLYALLFLAGGAMVSAVRYRSQPGLRGRYLGNILICLGAILPGIGGAMTRAGYVEVLYVTELMGLLLIYAGYRSCIAKPLESSVPEAKKTASTRPVSGRMAGS